MWSDPGFTEIQRHVELMDRYSVDTEVLEYGAFIPTAAKAAGIPMVQAVRLVNEYVTTAVREFPGRFVAAAAVDPFGGEEAVRELEQAVERHGLFGISLSTNVDGRHLD